MSSNLTQNCIVRKAEMKDIPSVFQMIFQLAEWEKMIHKIKITEEQLKQDFKENAFRCLVVESSKGSLIGYALYTVDYSTWDGKSLILNDIFINTEYRGQAVGERLFVEVMKDAKSLGCKRAHLHVLTWNPAKKFYKKLGCTEASDYQIYRLEQEHFTRLLDRF